MKLCVCLFCPPVLVVRRQGNALTCAQEIRRNSDTFASWLSWALQAYLVLSEHPFNNGIKPLNLLCEADNRYNAITNPLYDYPPTA